MNRQLAADDSVANKFCREPQIMSKLAVVIAAAGKSSRFGSTAVREKKVFRELKGRAVWLRSTEAFHTRDDVDQIIVVVSPEDLDWFRRKFQPNLAFMDIEVVAGGTERADSVQNALAQVRTDIDFVVIHDAARPLIVKTWIDEIVAAAEDIGAAIPAVPISSTVKYVEPAPAGTRIRVTKTVPREGLYAAQTPQVFRRQLLLDAYARREGLAVTDEAQLVELAGHEVAIVPGSPMNLKITTRDDLRMAEALIELLPKEKSLDQLQPGDDLDWLKPW